MQLSFKYSEFPVNLNIQLNRSSVFDIEHFFSEGY